MAKMDTLQDCTVCEMPYHRFSSEDPEHEHSYTACINALHERIEELEREKRLLHAEIHRLNGDV